MLSLVVPIYKNEKNIPTLIDALSTLSSELQCKLEVVFVVDGSPDNSHDLLRTALPNVPFSSTLILLTKNEGSFIAIRAGLSRSRGAYCAMLAADLQEPIDVILEMTEILIQGETDVVIAARSGRHDIWFERVPSEFFWRLYRWAIFSDIPRGGFDTFACTRQFCDRLLSLRESHSSLVGQIIWMGGRRKVIHYVRERRQIGRSSWTFKKKLGYLADSIFSFTDLPIQVLIYFGGGTASLSVALGIVVLFARLTGSIVVPGYSALALLITFFGASNIYALGIVGTYAWRAYENTKQRPLFSIHDEREFSHHEQSIGMNQ